MKKSKHHNSLPTKWLTVWLIVEPSDKPPTWADGLYTSLPRTVIGSYTSRFDYVKSQKLMIRNSSYNPGKYNCVIWNPDVFYKTIRQKIQMPSSYEILKFSMKRNDKNTEDNRYGQFMPSAGLSFYCGLLCDGPQLIGKRRTCVKMFPISCKAPTLTGNFEP